MPSASPSRYQSRFFNFLNRQSLRWSDRFERTVRHIKVAATWGVQILLYPAYLLVQTSLSVGRQLASEAEAGWPRLKEFTNKQRQETPSACDTPIQRVLEELKVEGLNELKVSRLNVEGSTQIYLQSSNLEPTSLSNLQPSNLQPSNLESTSLSNLQPTNLEPTNLSNLQPSNLQPSTPKERCLIRGVATLLEKRSLVLVTEQNQILDILTPQQQQKLAAKIVLEVADLLRQRRLVHSSKLENRNRRLSTSLNRPRVFLPAKLFWEVMAWVQTSPVAIAANLFQESTLVGEVPGSARILPHRPAPKPRHQLPPLTDRPLGGIEVNRVVQNQLAPQRALAFLDRTVAELESHQLVPGTEAVTVLWDSLQDRWTMWREANAANVLVVRERTQKISQQLKTPFITLKDSDSATQAQTSSFQIQALIYAAIEYFFGKRHSDLPETGSPFPSTILPNSQGQVHQVSGRHSTSLPPQFCDRALPGSEANRAEFSDTEEPDSWLSWDDLYGYPDARELAQPPHSQNLRESKRSNPARLPEAITQGVAPRAIASKIPYPNRQSRNRSKRTTPASLKTRSLAPVASPHSSISPATAKSSAVTVPPSTPPNNELEPAPDWIETRVTPIGYVKHPLEQVLEWLDRAMLRIEDLAVKVWHWVRQLRR